MGSRNVLTPPVPGHAIRVTLTSRVSQSRHSAGRTHNTFLRDLTINNARLLDSVPRVRTPQTPSRRVFLNIISSTEWDRKQVYTDKDAAQHGRGEKFNWRAAFYRYPGGLGIENSHIGGIHQRGASGRCNNGSCALPRPALPRVNGEIPGSILTRLPVQGIGRDRPPHGTLQRNSTSGGRFYIDGHVSWLACMRSFQVRGGALVLYPKFGGEASKRPTRYRKRRHRPLFYLGAPTLFIVTR